MMSNSSSCVLKSRVLGLGRSLPRLLAPVVCALLASCIDGREEYWLAGDGSGRAEIRYEVPVGLARSCGGEQGLEKLLDDFVRATPTLTNATRRVSCEGDRMVVDFKASFKSAIDLIDAVSGDSVLCSGNLKPVMEPLIGHFDFHRRGIKVELTRTVQPAKALPGSFLMPASQFAGRRLVYVMHLPAAAEESNATRTEDGGRTLIWDQPLTDGLRKSVIIHFKAAVPVPWRLLTTIAAVLALAGFIFVRSIRPRRKDAGAGQPQAS